MKKLFAGLDLGNWFNGLVAAAVGGGANAAVGAFSIKMDDDFYLVVCRMFLTGAGLSFFMYLKQNPVPKHVTEIIVTLKATTETATVKQTETRTDPLRDMQ